MKRVTLLASSLLILSTSALAGGPKAAPTPGAPKGVPNSKVAKVSADVKAGNLKMGNKSRTKVATFKDQKGTEINVACKLLNTKKLDCVLQGYDKPHSVTVTPAKDKDTLVLSYGQEGRTQLGLNEIHLVFPGVDGVHKP